MLSKTDVTSWFQTLESYKRIDVMCALLNICLPFELRFLGTCLEELGRRDSQELRGMELRVNNPQAVATDMHACQNSEPTDRKVRRKMALYLALIRACNRTCVNEIFRSLESWGELDFSTTVDKDTLQELLLVYTMAAHHPVFDFEQHMKCMQIFEKIKEHKLVVDPPETVPSNQISSPPNSGHTSANSVPLEMHIGQHQHTTQPHVDLMHQHASILQATSMQQTNPHPHVLNHNHVQMLSQGPVQLSYQQNHLTKLISADCINLQQSMGVENMSHMLPTNITAVESNKSATNAVITHSNTTAWTMRQYPPLPLLTDGPTITDNQNQSSSPIVSQQSSPCSSRPSSPNHTSSCDNVILHSQNTNHIRNLPTSRIGSISVKNVRRSSNETTPPPSLVQQHSPIMPNELIVSQNVKHITEVVMNNETSGNQLQNLIRNGFSRSSNYIRVKSGNYIPTHHQQQSPVTPQHYTGAFTINAGLTFGMHNMSMSDMTTSGAHQMEVSAILGMNSNKSTGSDSGSSIGSSGELSPPGTPTLMMNNGAVPNTALVRLNVGNGDNQSPSSQQHLQQHQPQKLLQPSQLSYNKQLGLSRLNGRSEKILSVNAVGAVSSGVVNPNPAIIYAQQQQSQVLQQTTTPQSMYTDVLLTPGSNGNTATVMQAALNNSCTVNNLNVVSTSNNMIGTNTVLISSPSGGGASNMTNVITSNSLLLQTQQQQYNTNYSYHAAAAAAAAQHLLANTARPPLMTHNPSMAPPPHGAFRLPGFQLQPNGEVYYQTFHPAGGIAFLSGGSPPGGPPMGLRTTNSTATAVNTSTATQPPTPQHIPPPPTQLATTPAVATLLASPYSTLTTGLSNKPMSCYNCGSQSHSGRECQEASMDDVTRSAVYKLDYSQAASGIGAGNMSVGSNVTTNTQVSTNSSEVSSTLHGTKLHDANSLIISNTSAVAAVSSLVSSVLSTTSSLNAK